MRIAVFGANGAIGSRIVREALDRGHQVTAVVRDPARVTLSHERLRTTVADATDSKAVAAAAKGHDVVVSAVGPAHGGPLDVLVGGAHSLVAGLRAAGIKRFVIVGGAGSLEVAPGKLLLDTPEFPAAWRPLAAAHADVLTFIRSVTDLDWSYLSPAAMIQAGERTGTYRTGYEQLLVDALGASKISTEDYAVALLDEIERPSHIRQRITVAY